MAKDLYVMPLWRFKVGDHGSPIEAVLGLRPKIITPEGIEERPASFTPADKRRAQQEVDAIRRAVEAANQVRIEWNDEGSVIYSSQTQHVEALRAYARWLDVRDQLPVFGEPPEGDYQNHPVRQLEPSKPFSCPHLVEHNCFNGYYLPCDFERLVEVEPYLTWGQRPASHSVGSSVRLRRELELLGEELRVREDYSYTDDDPLAGMKMAFLQLRKMADLSRQHGLPVIFWS